MNISMPKNLEKQIKAMAKEENRTKSELLREAFKSYKSSKEWQKIWAWGDKIARRMGIESYDDVEKIAG